MIKHKEIASRAGVSLDDLDQLVRGHATQNVAMKLGVTLDDVDQFIQGSATFNMTARLKLNSQAAAGELAGLIDRNCAIGILIGVLISS